MKKIQICFFIVGLYALPCSAKILQVTGVGAAASTIVSPGTYCKTIIIQNNGSGNVRLAIDGGTVQGLTDPTATTGYKLAAGAYLVLTYPANKTPPPIRAILETATTTTLDIVTDDKDST